MPLTPSAVDPLSYWPEAEYRLNYWLAWHPHCPKDYVKPVIKAVYEDSTIETCTYSPDDRVITVNPAVVSGCMAHEVGHAALHQAGNGCWKIYEHDLARAP